MPFIELPTIIQSKCIFCIKATITVCDITIYWSGGELRFYLGVSPDPNTEPTDWEEVTGLQTGVETSYTLVAANKALYYKIVKDYQTIIATQSDSIGRWTAPALRIRNFEVSS